MKVFFKPTDAGAQRPCTVPFAGCDYALARGACPLCEASESEAFKVQGVVGSMTRGHDRYVSDARCVACGAVVGKLVAVMNTLFGLEEDEAVLHGRCRVY